MKKYKASAIVTSSNIDDFNERLLNNISDMQKLGFQVEIQYQVNTKFRKRTYSALVLGYTKED